MTDDARLREALRAVLRVTPPGGPSRDLWPAIVERSRARARWTWLDLAIAAIVLALLSLRPAWLWLLLYHL